MSGAAGFGVAMMIAAPAAHATTTVWASPPFPSFESGGIHTDGTKSADEVTVGFDVGTNEFVVTDPAGVIVRSRYETTCTIETPIVARCPQLAPFVTSSLSGGDDRFTGDATLGAVQVSVQGDAGNDSIRLSNIGGNLPRGGNGDDSIAGGPGRDRVQGGHGNDRLTGRGGGDYVIGGLGTDWLSGGRGVDRLFAKDDHRDEAIVCGDSAKDEAEIDRGLDPEPRGCSAISK